MIYIFNVILTSLAVLIPVLTVIYVFLKFLFWADNYITDLIEEYMEKRRRNKRDKEYEKRLKDV